MPRPTPRFLALLLAVLVAPGCRPTPRVTPEQLDAFASTNPPNVEHRRDILTYEEIVLTSARDAFDAVVRLRPEFLGRRSAKYDDLDTGSARRTANERAEDTYAQYPAVFLNGVKQGGPAALKGIPVGSIRQIRYYRASNVPEMYGGILNRYGVIDVRTP